MKKELIKYCLRLGDNSLILSHRLAQYSSKGPFLEEDLAITNVSLDHLGQAQQWYNYAGELNGSKSADDWAYKRKEQEYFNCQLVEYPNIDFAYIIARQFFIDTYNYYLYTQLVNSVDTGISGIATKSLKEVTYHLRRSSEWVIRLGDGTSESKEKIQNALEHLWMYTGELFETDQTETLLIEANIAADNKAIQSRWELKVKEVLASAKLTLPESNYFITGGRNGFHSEHIGYILAEMQYLPNAYPDAIW